MKIAVEQEERKGEVKSLMRLGLIFWNLGQLDKSLPYYKKALLLAERGGFSEEYRECQSIIQIFKFYGRGKQKRDLQDYSASIQSFKTAVKYAREIGSKYHELKCLRQLSLSFWEIYDLQEFYLLNEKCLNLSKNLNHKSEFGKANNHIGLFYWKSNDYSNALYFYQEALRIARELGIEEEESACLSNIANVMQILGSYRMSIDYLKDALRIDERLKKEIYISKDLNNLGEVFRHKAIHSENPVYFKKALDYFERCYVLSKKIGDLRTQAKVLNNMGIVFLYLKDYSNAIKYFTYSYKFVVKINDLDSKGVVLNNMGFAMLQLGESGKAENLFKQAVEAGQNNYNKEILWEAYFGLGKCYEKRQDVSNALINYENAVNVIDRIRKGITIDMHKAGFARDKLKVYESLVSLLYRYRNHKSINASGEIFRVVESAKARAFLESLGESQINIRNRLTEAMKNRENDILNRISSGTRKLNQMHLTEFQRKKILREVKNAEDEYLLFISKIRIEIPEIANLVSPEPCTIEEVQKQITNQKTALIEYFLGESKSFVFLISEEEIYLDTLPGREEIRKSLKAYLKALAEQPGRSFNGEKASARLAKELLPITQLNALKSVENLVIIPDGILYYLPFETLLISNKKVPTENKLLLSRYNISYSPSSSSLLFLTRVNRKELPSKDLLAFGNPNYHLGENSTLAENSIPSNILKDVFQNEGFDLSPLPYSQKEVESISKLFSEKNKDVYFGNNACEDTLKRIPLEDYKIVHFACHGLLDEKVPSRSALVLSLGNCLKDDGFLQVREIYNLRLKSELVILSACQTARGKLENGEGVLGLPRIFFNSGTRSVISTLWKIDDKSTSKFMKYLYTYLNEGYDKTQSLTLAKLKMIKSGYHHPFYWAAFILNGDYSSPALRKNH
ncbi:MAG: CHAT domain-containing protein [Candidatus Aminicenantes bacterium]|nr:CHAT domain-containing protein [Candidatus Aminicenantes bacterium]